MTETVDIAIIGAGPAGLAAAETALEAGRRPVLFEAKPSVARKFLMAGKSGLNLTKDEPPDRFGSVFPAEMQPFMAAFGAAEASAWATDLGEPMFTGSSGRVFPVAMKGSPLLRRWLQRIERAEVRTRWRWTGWVGEDLVFETPEGSRKVDASATVLAMGGGSWPRLGSDGGWVDLLRACGVQVAPLRPANMGFDVGWSAHFASRFAGHPVKPAALTLGDRTVRGEFVVSATGIEGSAIYALSAPLRDALETGEAALRLDLAPGRGVESLTARLSRPRGRNSLANHLRKAIGLTGVRAGLLRELAPEGALDDPGTIASALKDLAIPVVAPRPLAEAISSAGGVAWDALDGNLMLRARPGVFTAGEMLDWEAPTGGYLLTGCLATGRHAGASAAAWSAP